MRARTRHLRGDSSRHSEAADLALRDAHEGLKRAHEASRQGDCSEAVSQFGGAMLSLGVAHQEAAWGNRPDLGDALREVGGGLARFASREMGACFANRAPSEPPSDLDRLSWDDLRCSLVRRRIAVHDDNRNAAARSFGMAPSTLREWMQKCGVPIRENVGRPKKMRTTTEAK